MLHWSLSTKQQSTKAVRVSLGPVLTQEQWIAWFLLKTLKSWQDVCLEFLLPLPSPPVLVPALSTLLLWMFQHTGRILHMNNCEMKNWETPCRVTDPSQDLCLLIPALHRFCQFTWLQSEQFSWVTILPWLNFYVAPNWKNDFVKRD